MQNAKHLGRGSVVLDQCDGVFRCSPTVNCDNAATMPLCSFQRSPKHFFLVFVGSLMRGAAVKTDLSHQATFAYKLFEQPYL